MGYIYPIKKGTKAVSFHPEKYFAGRSLIVTNQVWEIFAPPTEQSLPFLAPVALLVCYLNFSCIDRHIWSGDRGMRRNIRRRI